MKKKNCSGSGARRAAVFGHWQKRAECALAARLTGWKIDVLTGKGGGA